MSPRASSRIFLNVNSRNKDNPNSAYPLILVEGTFAVVEYLEEQPTECKTKFTHGFISVSDVLPELRGV